MASVFLPGVITYLVVLLSLSATESQNVSQLYNASNQALTSVPLDAGEVHDLRLDHNLLTELPVGVFRSLIRLNNLSVSYNSLHTDGIDRHCLAGTVVAHLYLDHNYLSDIPYLNHSHVVQLSMRYNSILRVEDGAFQGMPLLTSVQFQSNQIHDINPSVSCGRQVGSIGLGHNALSAVPQFFCLNNTLKSIYSETWELGTPKGLPNTLLNSKVVIFLRFISMY